VARRESMTDGSEVCGECGTVLVKTTVVDVDTAWYSDGPGPYAGADRNRVRVLMRCPRCQPHSRGGIATSSIAEETRRALS
jgi:hypothetical protein